MKKYLLIFPFILLISGCVSNTPPQSYFFSSPRKFDIETKALEDSSISKQEQLFVKQAAWPLIGSLTIKTVETRAPEIPIKLEDGADILLKMTTILSSLSTILLVYYTRRQRVEEKMKYQAYISFRHVRTELNQDGFNIKLEVKNHGQTPATDLKTLSFLMINNKMVGHNGDSPSSYLTNHDEPLPVNVPITYDQARQLKGKDGIFFIVIKYLNYQKRNVLLISKMSLAIKEVQGKFSQLVLNNIKVILKSPRPLKFRDLFNKQVEFKESVEIEETKTGLIRRVDIISSKKIKDDETKELSGRAVISYRNGKPINIYSKKYLEEKELYYEDDLAKYYLSELD